ncbi:MAG: LysR family transcriptional regulator [Alphaproteobacteria bacterium]|nr:LysR family transcriptional regulator [Alphaproteobacteria bacterium]
MDVTVRQLQAFIAVAEQGSFTRAAERLHVAQSAVSILVRQLEAALGIRLLDRTTRRVELTEGGRDFHRHAETLLADLAAAVRSAHDLAAARRGRVAVAAPPLLAAALLPQVIAAFQAGHPGVDVALIDGRTDQIAAMVRAGEATFAVGTFARDEEGVARKRLVHDRLHMFCPAGHPLAARQRLLWRHLKGEKLVALTRDSGIRALVDRTLDRFGLAIEPAFEVAQIATALALVEAGLGVSVLPTYALAILAGRPVAARALGEPTVAREIAVVWAQGRSLPPAATAFVAQLQASVAADWRRLRAAADAS